MVVNAALQEDVDAIGISILSGAHMTVFPKIIAGMKEKGMNGRTADRAAVSSPDADMETLQEMGVGKLFPPGTNTKDISSYITDWVAAHRIFLEKITYPRNIS